VAHRQAPRALQAGDALPLPIRHTNLIFSAHETPRSGHRKQKQERRYFVRNWICSETHLVLAVC
jgi:hypothetical protein